VLLLREAAEGARIEAEALRRQLDEATSGAARREQDEHDGEHEQGRLMATCLQLRGLLASVDAATATAATAGSAAETDGGAGAGATGGARDVSRGTSRSTSREISRAPSRPESPGVGDGVSRALPEEARARPREISVLSIPTTLP